MLTHLKKSQEIKGREKSKRKSREGEIKKAFPSLIEFRINKVMPNVPESPISTRLLNF